MKKLDRSCTSEKDEAQKLKQEYIEGDQRDGLEQYFDDQEEQKVSQGWFEKLKGKVQYYTGNKNIDEEDLEPICEQLKNSLIDKNVSSEIATKLCSDVLNKLKQTKSERFTSVPQTVKNSFQQSLSQILHTNRQIDILRDALTAKSQGRIFVITFCGVNGVGKSTNLAKIAYMLKTQGKLSLLITACDTFRSGAVEQLKKHALCLQVPLFEKGYGKDPALVAQQAISYAKENEIDVVLVDTAGRMQDNVHLMQNLAKLVNINRPDLVLFVGEALVGNDGVDQLMKFNQSLRDQTDSGRGIDGIILTKFDTVDDKVGAAISMIYASGKPIVFLGTGQKYTHLRTLNVATVVNNLLA